MVTRSAPSPNAGRILVVRGGAIGDFILTLPVLAALRRAFPPCRLEVLGYSHVVGLAQAAGLADAVRSIETRPMAGFFAQGGSLAPDLADYFAQFALVVSFLYDPDGIFRANVGRCSPAQFVVGPHRPDDCPPRPMSEILLTALEPLAIFDADPVPRLSIEPGAAGPHGLGGDGWRPGECWLALHPGSGSERKNWPAPCWEQLVSFLVHHTNAQLLLVGGEAEAGRLDQLARGIPPERRIVARNEPLVDLARRLAACRGFVGHDSGITHLAAALSLPGRVLWGPTDARIWQPQGGRMKLLQHADGLAHLPVGTVQHEVLALVS